MIPDWTREVKVLSNIKKIAAAAWRMNSRQLQSYCEKLRKNQPALLPGKLGSAFLELLEQTSAGESGAARTVWPGFIRDAECMQDIIRRYCQLDQKRWHAVLLGLEVQQEQYFKTALGTAFILALKDKLGVDMMESRQAGRKEKKTAYSVCKNDADEKRELEQTAIWLMTGAKERSAQTKMRKRNSVSDLARRAAVPVLAGISVCLMAVWLYGQMERNQMRWNLQQMKLSAAQKTADLAKENFQPEADALKTQEKQPDTGLYSADGQSQGERQSESGTQRQYQAEAGQEELENLQEQQKEAAQPQKQQEILPQYQEMSDQYPELYGWLQIPGTQIDMPVMCPKVEREFYLHHDFTGAESAEGALFVDSECAGCLQNANTVVYGHNMKNGHIFGTLKLYEDTDFFQAHREIHFDTLYESGIYEAAAVLKTRILNENEQGFRYYQFFEYENKETFQECLDFVKENQIFETDCRLQYGDRILMLSTCEYSQENGRLVIVARKL